jgi:hypothetical protein
MMRLPNAKVFVRSSRSGGDRLFPVDVHASGTAADVKWQLCQPPHSMCSDVTQFVPVLKGKGGAICILPVLQLTRRLQVVFCAMIPRLIPLLRVKSSLLPCYHTAPTLQRSFCPCMHPLSQL